ncbi:hypothetical protein DL96DRAFT_624033 [Flagelloscypha sp. PMI_526]|nr:hypothetical protein DL96DRAFT_624033 [Flagelloscypha sp. PMI_526]
MGAFDFTVGAILIGFALNMYLYGLVCYQYLAYKTVKFGDVIWLRSLVGVLFVIDTYQTIVEFYGVWYFAVENYTTPSVLGRVIWVTPLIGISTTISTFVFQGFLISRLFRFTSQFWLCSFLFLAAVAAFVLGVIDCTKAWLLVDVTKFSALIPLTIAWLAIEAGIDIIVAVILSRSLWRCKTGFTRTNTVINRCVRASIQSGLVSSVFAILNFLVFVLRSDTYLYAIFHWPLGRIYSNFPPLYVGRSQRSCSDCLWNH